MCDYLIGKEVGFERTIILNSSLQSTAMTSSRILITILTYVIVCLTIGAAAEKPKVPEFEEYETHPMLLKDVAPVAPSGFYRKGNTGEVTVKLLVDEQGIVRKVEAKQGPRKLRKIVKEAILKRQYKPYERDGRPTPFYTWATISFPPRAWSAPCEALSSSELPEGVYRVSEGISAPKPLETPDPEYSEEARDERIMGTLCFSLIVREDGSPSDIYIQRGIGYGLDEKAIETLKQWRFTPGVKDGKAVPVQIPVSMTFRLY